MQFFCHLSALTNLPGTSPSFSSILQNLKSTSTMKMQLKELQRMEQTIEALKNHERYISAPTEVTNKYYARHDSQQMLYVNTKLALPPMPCDKNIIAMRRTSLKINCDVTSMILERFSSAVYLFDQANKNPLASIMTEKDPRIFLLKIKEFLRITHIAASIPLKQDMILLYKESPLTLDYLSAKEVLHIYSRLISGHNFVDMGKRRIENDQQLALQDIKGGQEAFLPARTIQPSASMPILFQPQILAPVPAPNTARAPPNNQEPLEITLGPGPSNSNKAGFTREVKTIPLKKCETPQADLEQVIVRILEATFSKVETCHKFQERILSLEDDLKTEKAKRKASDEEVTKMKDSIKKKRKDESASDSQSGFSSTSSDTSLSDLEKPRKKNKDKRKRN